MFDRISAIGISKKGKENVMDHAVNSNSNRQFQAIAKEKRTLRKTFTQDIDSV